MCLNAIAGLIVNDEPVLFASPLPALLTPELSLAGLAHVRSALALYHTHGTGSLDLLRLWWTLWGDDLASHWPDVAELEPPCNLTSVNLLQ